MNLRCEEQAILYELFFGCARDFPKPDPSLILLQQPIVLVPMLNISFMQMLDSKCGPPKKGRMMVVCPHKDRKHYAKNLCINCYHRYGRSKRAWLCEHIDKPHYAHGKCQNCYLSTYHEVTL